MKLKVVRKRGFEPLRYCYRQPLKTIRLGRIANNEVASPALITPVIFYIMKSRALRSGKLKISGMTL